MFKCCNIQATPSNTHTQLIFHGGGALCSGLRPVGSENQLMPPPLSELQLVTGKVRFWGSWEP